MKKKSRTRYQIKYYGYQINIKSVTQIILHG